MGVFFLNGFSVLALSLRYSSDLGSTNLDSGYLGQILGVILNSYMIACKRNQFCASVSHLKMETILASTSQSIRRASAQCLALCTFMNVISVNLL